MMAQDFVDMTDPEPSGSTLGPLGLLSDSELLDIWDGVYRDVWDAFYSWNTEACRQILQELAVPEPGQLQYKPDAPEQLSSILEDSGMGDGVTRISMISYQDYTDGALAGGEIYVECEEFNVPDSFPPHPPYETCTPLLKNIAQRKYNDTDEADVKEIIGADTVINNGRLAFIPLADDQSFSVDEYAALFRDFSWQYDFRNPDDECIQLECVRRLRLEYGLDANDVTQREIFKWLRISNESGLIWDTSQRDLFVWPGDSSIDCLADELAWNFVPAKHKLLDHLDIGLAMFCANLNCIESRCPAHTGRHADLSSTLVEAKLRSDGLRFLEGDACGPQCFRHADDVALESVLWTEDTDIEIFRDLLKIMPDCLPCDLSVIHRKPCREVFAYRCRILIDYDILDPLPEELQTSSRDRYETMPANRHKKSKKKRNFSVPTQYVDETPVGRTPQFVPIPPCVHKGPCDRGSGCKCDEHKHHCSRACRCAPDCARRWKGCDCRVVRGRACAPDTCPCRASGRECDPERCRRCGARTTSLMGCQNKKIQRGQTQHIEIKWSEWGFGAFATSRIEAGALVGDYLGEITNEEDELINTSESMEMLVKHTGRNYMFELHGQGNLDSLYAGNETRFINHAPESEANCNANVMLVNNEHKIGIYSIVDIEAGAQLLMDYGEGYWGKKTSDAIVEEEGGDTEDDVDGWQTAVVYDAARDDSGSEYRGDDSASIGED